MSVLTMNAFLHVKIHIIISLNKNIPRILENILFSGFSISRKIIFANRKKQIQRTMYFQGILGTILTVKCTVCTYDNNTFFTSTVMNLWKIYKNLDDFIMFIP